MKYTRKYIGLEHSRVKKSSIRYVVFTVNLLYLRLICYIYMNVCDEGSGVTVQGNRSNFAESFM